MSEQVRESGLSEQRCPGCGEFHVLTGGLCAECNLERIEEAQEAVYGG